MNLGLAYRLAGCEKFREEICQQGGGEESDMEKAASRKAPAAVLQSIPFLVDFPSRRVWVDYDDEADVLYINSERPQRATDTRMTDDGILLRYRDKELVGVTVLAASWGPDS